VLKLSLDEILTLGLEEGVEENPTRAQSPVKAGSDRTERLIRWLLRRGGRATAREVAMHRVAGVRNTAEARRLLRSLAAQGRGRFVVERSGKTRQRKEIFELLPGV